MEWLIIAGLLGLLGWGCYYATTRSDGSTTHSKLSIRRSLEATVIRACTSCGASGVDDRNKYVGEICPSCGATRPPIESKGEIWAKVL